MICIILVILLFPLLIFGAVLLAPVGAVLGGLLLVFSASGTPAPDDAETYCRTHVDVSGMDNAAQSKAYTQCLVAQGWRQPK